jgi:hypothetical protein
MSYSSPTPLRLNSLKLLGTKYSTHFSACPADRLIGVFLWKPSSQLDDFRLGRLLNFVGFKLSILNFTCCRFSEQFENVDGPDSAASLCQETTDIAILSSHIFSTLCTARDFEPPAQSVVKLRNAELMSSCMRLKHIAITTIPTRM